MLRAIILSATLACVMTLTVKEPTASDSAKMIHGQIQANREVYIVVNCKGGADEVCARSLAAIEGAVSKIEASGFMAAKEISRTLNIRKVSCFKKE